MFVNQANLRGLNVTFSTAYNKAFDGVKTNYEKIATTVPSTTAETDYKWLGQLPQMKEWVGEREIQKMAAYGYSIKNKKFEMTVSVPRDDIEDDQYGVYTPLFSNMGEAAAEHPDTLVFETMKKGFTEKCYDGKPFFATDHPSGEGGKTPTSNMSHLKLSTDSYEAARTAIMSVTGDKGKSLNLVPDLLVVAPANEKMARLILKADQIEGTTNVYKDTAELLVATELADKPDAWFLLCTNKFLKPFIFQKRKPVELTALTRNNDENVFMRDEFVWGADGRSNAGYGFWQMAYGSDGTGYLAKRYKVPFVKTPQVINKFAKDIALYNLVSRKGIDESEREKTYLTRYNSAITFLTKVAEGKIDIGVSEKSIEDAAKNGFSMKNAKRLFTRESMRGW